MYMLFTFRPRNDYRRIGRGNDKQNPVFGENGDPNALQLSKS